MILRKLIRQIIKESLILEKYKEGDSMIGSLSSILKDFEESDYEKEEEFNTTTPGRAPAPNANKQQNHPGVADPRITPQKNQAPSPDNGTYEDKQVADNHIQFKEGYDVYRNDEESIGVKNLESSKANNYKIKYGFLSLTINKLKMSLNGTASLTGQAAGLTETVKLTKLNKQTIMTNFENNTKSFDVDGKTVSGRSGTVKFIKVP
jgi:hypothetical protein